MLDNGFEIIGPAGEITSLTLRSENVAMIAVSLLAFSFFVIALARLSSRQMVVGMFLAVVNNKQLEKTIQEEYPLNSPSSFFLIVNYVISGSAMLFLCLPSKAAADQWLMLMLLPIPFFAFFLPWISLHFAGFVTGEKDIVSECKINTILLAHFSGLVYSLLLLIWAFNIQWTEIFIKIFVGVTFFIWICRFLRGFGFALRKGAPWYYIILYFCTLEILPLILCYMVFNWKMEEELKWLLN